MIKKIWWQAPLVITGSLALGAGIFCGAVYMQKANPYRNFYKQPTAEGASAIMQAYMSAIINGSKVLILPGYTHTNPLTNFLAETPSTNDPIYNQANKAGYILLDDIYGLPKLNPDGQLSKVTQPLFTTQVASAMFRTDLGAFMTGIAIGQFLNDNQEYFLKGKNKTYFTWATYGGDTFSSVTGYMGGFQRGIKWFNENIVPKTEGNFKEIKQEFIESGELANFTKSFDATAGNNLITQFLQKDVDVLIPVAGTQTTQAVRLINQYKKRCVVIGVDAPAENDTGSNLPLIDGKDVGNGMVIQFSCVKGLDTVGATILDRINSNQPQEQNIGGFGWISVGTPQNGGVGISGIGKDYFTEAMRMYLPQVAIPDYQRAVVEAQSIFEKEKLNDPANKSYNIPGNTTSHLSYPDLLNEAKMMMPWDTNQLKQWCEYYYPETSEITYNSCIKWLDQHKTEVQKRKDFTLKNQLTPKAYDDNQGVIRVIPNSPNVPLLDKSFTQTAYMGVVKYWEGMGIKAPDPTEN